MVAIDLGLSAPSATPEQSLLALAVLLAILVGAVILGYRARYGGLPAPLDRDKPALAGSKASADFQTIRFPSSTDFHATETRERVRRLFDPEADIERTTAGDAVGEIRRALGEAWAPVVMALPKPARWLLSLAANMGVFGFLAVSTDVVLRVLRAEPRAARPLAQWPATAAAESAKVVDLVGSVLFALPGVAIVWSLLFSFLILAGTWFYAHWYVVVVLLLVGVGSVTLAYRRVDAEPGGVTVQLPAARSVARRGVAATVIVWAATLVGIGLGRRFASDWWGVRIGAGLGAAVALGLLGYGVYRAGVGVRGGGGRFTRFLTQTPSAKVLTIVRGGWLAFAAFVSPLLPIYVVVALTKLPAIWGALSTAAPEIQVVALLVVGFIVGGLGHAARSAWDDVRAALVEGVSQQTVRATVVGRGVPVLAVVGGYIVAYGFLRSIVMAASVAVVAGLAVRGVYLLALRVKYRASRGDRSDDVPATRVVVQAATLEDDGGDPHYFARVNGDIELLHPERDELVDTVVGVGDELLTTGEADPTLPEWHSKFAFELGVTDPEETEAKLREKARKRLYHQLRENDHIAPTDDVDEALREYPTEIRDRRIDREIYLGNIRWRPDYVELRNDPFA